MVRCFTRVAVSVLLCMHAEAKVHITGRRLGCYNFLMIGEKSLEVIT